MKLALYVLFAISVATPAMAQTDGKAQAVAVPKVYLSERHETMVNVGVGDTFPELLLPEVDRPGDPPPFSARLGKLVTVVGVFGRDSAMAKTLLRDLEIDINQLPPSSDGSTALPIAMATGLSSETAQKLATESGYKGLLLLDETGKGFEQLGNTRMPRVYVLDAEGKIVWFDIEYSNATRREMKQAIEALTSRSK